MLGCFYTMDYASGKEEPCKKNDLQYFLNLDVVPKWSWEEIVNWRLPHNMVLFRSNLKETDYSHEKDLVPIYIRFINYANNARDTRHRSAGQVSTSLLQNSFSKP